MKNLTIKIVTGLFGAQLALMLIGFGLGMIIGTNQEALVAWQIISQVLFIYGVRTINTKGWGFNYPLKDDLKAYLIAITITVGAAIITIGLIKTMGLALPAFWLLIAIFSFIFTVVYVAWLRRSILKNWDYSQE
jgi:hypothetical protein